ncbi:hypothetical protein COB55_05605 [Candidatus Wolfebacteria bacterium]|nr:MAG: hypothetical protein COB55_05605 [Candidatus Wolfebacteria bacterium]
MSNKRYGKDIPFYVVNRIRKEQGLEPWDDYKPKTYTYTFEYPNIRKHKDEDRVYSEILKEFEEQLKDWIYG